MARGSVLRYAITMYSAEPHFLAETEGRMKRFLKNLHFYTVLVLLSPLLFLVLMLISFYFGGLWVSDAIEQYIALEPRAVGVVVLCTLAICYTWIVT